MLGAEDKLRHARQLLLPEIGAAGQARLLAATATTAADADARAAVVALDYLGRAGVKLSADSRSVVPLPDLGAVRSVAGRPELEPAAAALLGAFGAVETIKAVLGAGRPAPLPLDLRLGEGQAS